MLRNYQEAVEYLYTNLPMFQRVGSVAFKKDLTNTIRLCEALDNPHQKFKSVHVTGTNGKGSTSHMLASILQSAGYKTGLYTSPHLKEFTERIRVNGKEVDRQFVVDFVNKILPLIEAIKPSFFEITVAMAFDFFAFSQVDIAVIEVGLGGRLDSTNVIQPVLSLITNIGLDHTDLLGDTLQKIAEEKAGIIKTGIPVVISEYQAEVEDVFREKARQSNAPISYGDHLYEVKLDQEKHGSAYQISHKSSGETWKGFLSLQGSYQSKNIPGVIQAIDLLRQRGFDISDESINHGLANVTSQTALKGRWQQLGELPLVICDTGHNADGIREIIKQLGGMDFKRLHMIWGAVKDKDISGILNLLPKTAQYYFCEAKIPRALDAALLKEQAFRFGLNGIVIRDVNMALERAKQNASPNDLIFVGGSTFVVAELENL